MLTGQSDESSLLILFKCQIDSTDGPGMEHIVIVLELVRLCVVNKLSINSRKREGCGFLLPTPTSTNEELTETRRDLSGTVQ